MKSRAEFLLLSIVSPGLVAMSASRLSEEEKPNELKETPNPTTRHLAKVRAVEA
jgi:hypothetical protein